MANRIGSQSETSQISVKKIEKSVSVSKNHIGQSLINTMNLRLKAVK